MKKFLKTTWAVLLYLWQLPQNLLGLTYLAFCFDRVKITEQRGAVFYATKHVRGGMTLGRYVFIAPGNIDREPVYDHEFGHVRQSVSYTHLRAHEAGYGCPYSRFRAACIAFSAARRTTTTFTRRGRQIGSEACPTMPGNTTTTWTA